MEISIVILNYNGLAFLKECLASVMQAVKEYGRQCEVIVVDNGSFDGSIAYVEEHFSAVRVISFNENLSFTKAMNKGIRETRAPWVICLNNDTVVERDFIAPLVSYFSKNEGVFAIAAKMLHRGSGNLNFGRVVADFRFGFFMRSIVDAQFAKNSLYGCAGGFAIDKNKFMSLGGFDEDFSIYWEDTDLCYRAWKRGWRTVYEPRSTIYHAFHGTNAQKLGQQRIDALSGEHYSLFVLKNIHDRMFFGCHCLALPLLLCASIARGKVYFAKGVLCSFRRSRVFLRKRADEKSKNVISDRQVLSLIGTHKFPT